MLLFSSLLTVLLINVVLFLVAYKHQSDKLTDFSYALSFIVVAVSAFMISTHKTILLSLTVGMVIIWAFRLGGFLIYRIRKTSRDTRFDDIRSDFWQFLKFWIGQAVVAWILLLPVLFLANRNDNLNALSYAGIAIWLVGVMIEAIADIQKFRFSQDAANKGKWIDIGLWHYSRHPNYFGEICVWIGMYLTVFSSLGEIEKLVGLASPIVIFITLRFISGVPPLEKSADKKWGDNPEYRMYKKRTNLIIPFLPKKNVQ